MQARAAIKNQQIKNCFYQLHRFTPTKLEKNQKKKFSVSFASRASECEQAVRLCQDINDLINNSRSQSCRIKENQTFGAGA
jgi:hypothetical protein